MENLDMLNTTPYIESKVQDSKINRSNTPKKVKLRPASMEGIYANLGKFPKEELKVLNEPVVSNPVESAETQVVTPEVVVPTVAPATAPVASSNTVTSSVPTAPTISEVSTSVEKPVEKVSQLASLTFVETPFPERVSGSNTSLPKGLKLKEEKEKNMLAKAPVPVIQPSVKDLEPLDAEDEQFQTVELQLDPKPENKMDVSSSIEEPQIDGMNQSDTTGLYGTMSLDGMLSVGGTSSDSLDDTNDFEETPVSEFVSSKRRASKSTDDEISDLKEVLAKQEVKSEPPKETKQVVPIYELCEAIDTQRLKTKEAEEKASRLSQDFQVYKEKSQLEIDASYREVKEAGDSQSEAEARYQIAEQEHKSALQNLIDTGKNQQKMLQQRQKQADETVRKVVQERKQLEQTNNTTLAQNKVQLQKYLNRTIELNNQTQLKNEEKAKWEAIARAMQDPEEDLMGYINPDDIYEVDSDTSIKSYGRRIA